MTAFIVLSAVMGVAAIAFVAWPLLRKSDSPDSPDSSARIGAIVFSVAVPVVAASLYLTQSNWDWDRAATEATQQASAEVTVATLKARLQKSPDDLGSWLMLGRSLLALERSMQAAEAYQKAVDLSKGENIEALLGLGESLVLSDETALRGRAGEIFEQVLARDPANPTALWYGAITALTSGDLVVARQRMASLLALNPPQQIRDILERQIQDIDQQLGVVATAKQPESPAKAAGRGLTVNVTLAPGLASQIDPRMPLFVLARDGSGPPLAAVRRAAGDLPLTVTLSESDAMIAGRSIATVDQVQVIARIAKVGTPQAQSGDLYGEVAHKFDSNKNATIDVVINRVAP